MFQITHTALEADDRLKSVVNESVGTVLSHCAVFI